MYVMPKSIDSDIYSLADVMRILFEENNYEIAAEKQAETIKKITEDIKKYKPPSDVILDLSFRILEGSYEIISRDIQMNVKNKEEDHMIEETKNFLEYIESEHKDVYNELISTEPFNVLVQWFIR